MTVIDQINGPTMPQAASGPGPGRRPTIFVSTTKRPVWRRFWIAAGQARRRISRRSGVRRAGRRGAGRGAKDSGGRTDFVASPKSSRSNVPMFPLTHLRGSAAGLFLFLLLPAAAAQPFVYGMNEKGRLSINNTLLDSLPGDFDPDSLPIQDPEDAWLDLAVDGADRFALRLDGRIFKNGALYSNSLPFAFGSPNTDFWDAISVTPTTVLAMR